MNSVTGNTTLSTGKQRLLTIMHWLVLIAAGGLIAWITRDTLQGVQFLNSPYYRKFQLCVCLLFQLDILVEFILAPRKLRYIGRNLLFILVSIPYMNILDYTGVHISSEALYALSFVPMVRAAFVFAIITGALTSSRTLSTFYVYLIWVCASLFFASLMFYEGEHYINSDVDNFWMALWWACMSMSTAGCYITPISTTGNILEIFLAAEGMMLIPVFTVYITRAVLRNSPSQTT